MSCVSCVCVCVHAHVYSVILCVSVGGARSVMESMRLGPSFCSILGGYACVIGNSTIAVFHICAYVVHTSIYQHNISMLSGFMSGILICVNIYSMMSKSVGCDLRLPTMEK